nr:hypothetical protein CFP56_78068 [Quercus suber]
MGYEVPPYFSFYITKHKNPSFSLRHHTQNKESELQNKLLWKSLFSSWESFSKKKQLLQQQHQQNKLLVAVGSNNIIRWLALSLRLSFLLSPLQMVFLSLSIGSRGIAP